MGPTFHTNFDSRLSEDASNRVLETAVSEERRAQPRFLINAPVVVHPLFAKQMPGTPIHGRLLDVSCSGLGVQLHATEPVTTTLCVVGIQYNDKHLYSTVEVRSRSAQDNGIRIGGQFVQSTIDPFHPENLIPQFDPSVMRLAPAIDPEALTAWLNYGVLIPQVLDSVKSCPQCAALPTFRSGCLDCGSPKTVSARLVHHFECGHVALETDFGNEGRMTCPKCRKPDLREFHNIEYMLGPARCEDCGWKGAQAAMIGECLMCGLRFHAEAARQEEVTQFYVPRLDPLAFINESEHGA